ncbi:MAG TPA: glycosyltransferase [Candidatus Omnitrophota bacterium]|nr:glycosyltransferase [Candidatus Omnitrophota bacterium]
MKIDTSRRERPVCTVIMPVYNARAYVGDAIGSILKQTFSDFEFLIFDDCSQDGTIEIIKSFHDARINFFQSKQHQGYLPYLNEGLRLAKGSYIARMDADDVSFPKRLRTQVDFMNSHPNIAAVGTWVMRKEQNKRFLIRKKTDPDIVRCELLFNNPLVHSSAMVRTACIRRHKIAYDEHFYTAEDYKMWLDISRVADLANIPRILLMYRTHPAQTGNVSMQKQRGMCKNIVAIQLERLGINATPDEIEKHTKINHEMLHIPLETKSEWFARLEEANKQRMVYNNNAFARALSENWTYNCFTNKKVAGWLKILFKKGLVIKRSSMFFCWNTIYSLFWILREARVSQVIASLKKRA